MRYINNTLYLLTYLLINVIIWYDKLPRLFLYHPVGLFKYSVDYARSTIVKSSIKHGAQTSKDTTLAHLLPEACESTWKKCRFDLGVA